MLRLKKKKKEPVSRSSHLGAAGKARAKGKKKQAIASYRKLLEERPKDYEVHRKLAPLLAETKQFEEAWVSFRMAAKLYDESGFTEKAVSMCSQAVRYMPRKCEAWEMLAKLQLKRGHKNDALKSLLSGRAKFTGRRYRRQAVTMIKNALNIKPWDLTLSLDLARLLRKTKDKEKALKLLRGLAERYEGDDLRIILREIFVVSPTPVNLWHWVRGR